MPAWHIGLSSKHTLGIIRSLVTFVSMNEHELLLKLPNSENRVPRFHAMVATSLGMCHHLPEQFLARLVFILL